MGPNGNLISQILCSPAVYAHSPWVSQGRRLPAFWCSGSLGSQHFSILGVKVPEVQPSNPFVSQDPRFQPLAVLKYSFHYLGSSRPSHRSSSLCCDFPKSVTRLAPAPPLTCRPYSLLSTPGDCGFWTWQPGPHYWLSRLGPQHACCLHRQPLLLPYCC